MTALETIAEILSVYQDAPMCDCEWDCEETHLLEVFALRNWAADTLGDASDAECDVLIAAARAAGVAYWDETLKRGAGAWVAPTLTQTELAAVCAALAGEVA